MHTGARRSLPFPGVVEKVKEDLCYQYFVWLNSLGFSVSTRRDKIRLSRYSFAEPPVANPADCQESGKLTDNRFLIRRSELLTIIT